MDWVIIEDSDRSRELEYVPVMIRYIETYIVFPVVVDPGKDCRIDMPWNQSTRGQSRGKETHIVLNLWKGVNNRFKERRSLD